MYANLLRLEIGSYLLSKDFNYLLIEKNLDSLWNNIKSKVISQSYGIVLIPGYTGYVDKTLGKFIDYIYNSKGSVLELSKILSEILNDFKKWKGKIIDLKEIKKCFVDLGLKPNIVNDMFKSTMYYEKSKIDTDFQIPKFNNEKIDIDNSLCFVLMPFEKKFDAIYEKIIKKVVEDDCSYKCKRADEIFGTKPIIEDIWEYIRKAKFLISELTNKNPNVYYELGIAHALEKDVILITQNIDNVPFDLRHYRCLIYEDSIVGAELLGQGLKDTINVLFNT